LALLPEEKCWKSHSTCVYMTKKTRFRSSLPLQPLHYWRPFKSKAQASSHPWLLGDAFCTMELHLGRGGAYKRDCRCRANLNNSLHHIKDRYFSLHGFKMQEAFAEYLVILLREEQRCSGGNDNGLKFSPRFSLMDCAKTDLTELCSRMCGSIYQMRCLEERWMGVQYPYTQTHSFGQMGSGRFISKKCLLILLYNGKNRPAHCLHCST